MSKRTLTLAAATVTAVLAVTACDTSAKEVGDASLRTLVSKLGEVSFKEENHPIDGELSCATSDGKSYTITCTGHDTAKKPVRLVVKADRKKDVSSSKPDRIRATSVIGTVDGKEVFSQKCLGSAC